MSENNQNQQIKILDIPENPLFKSVNFISTKNAPLTRTYFTSHFNSSTNSISNIGGTDINCEQPIEISSYNLEHQSWENSNVNNENTFNKKITGHASVLIHDSNQNKIFVYGGFEEPGEYSSNSYFITPENMTFTKIEYQKNKKGIIEFPSKRAYHTVNFDSEHNVVYVYGGTDLNMSNSRKEMFQCVWEFNITNLSWDKILLSNYPKEGSPRAHTSIIKGNKLYVFGGIILFKKYTNTMYCIDLTKKTIDKVEYGGSYPKPVAFHSAVEVNEKCFMVYGGLDENYLPLNDCYVYFYSTKLFIKIDIPCLPKLFGQQNVNNGKGSIFIIGGMDNFKYVGDESLICKEEEVVKEDKGEEKENNDKIEMEFKPMETVIEIFIKI